MATRVRRKKRTEEDELEQVREELRKAKATIRSLTKQLKKLNRGAKRIEILEEIVKDESFNKEEYAAPAVQLCGECRQGPLEETNIVGRKFLSCAACGWRGRAPKAR